MRVTYLQHLILMWFLIGLFNLEKMRIHVGICEYYWKHIYYELNSYFLFGMSLWNIQLDSYKDWLENNLKLIFHATLPQKKFWKRIRGRLALKADIKESLQFVFSFKSYLFCEFFFRRSSPEWRNRFNDSYVNTISNLFQNLRVEF